MVSAWQRTAVCSPLFLLLIAANRCNSLANTPQSSRRRAAETKGSSSHSADQSRSWYENRSSSKGQHMRIIRNNNRVRSPRWETEGDSLYHVISENGTEKIIIGDEFETARDLLATLPTVENVVSTIIQPKPTTSIQKNSKKEGTKTPPSNTMWGSCSVGPILRSRLVADLAAPTPIQEAAFSVLTNKRRDNAILASPTGSGKTLAYLLPLMSVMKQTKPQCMLVVTPTVDLAYQIQREVNRLWPITTTEEGRSSSAMHVVEQRTEEEDETPLLCVEATEAPILAGTPRALLKLVAEMKQSNQMMASLLSNLKTIVLDESDHLLRTHVAARDRIVVPKTTRHQQRKHSVSSPTGLLLSELPLDYNDKSHRIQLVCASASVGRTLRRQIMELTRAPSMDKAAVLITADSRTKKDATLRRVSLLPPTIQHRYVLRRKEEETNNTKDDTCAFIEVLWDTLKQVPPAPILVFPGKANVAPVAEALQSVLGFTDVRTLRDRKHSVPVAASCESWKETTVYVMGEKFARGLDISVDYVIVSAPPSSPAAYIHLAGRTGRNGRPGMAITLVQGMKEARRVVALAGALEVGFEDLATASKESVAIQRKALTVDQAMAEGGSALQIHNPWENLTKSALTRKTVAELTEYLMERGIAITYESGKKKLKADLLSSLKSLQDES